MPQLSKYVQTNKKNKINLIQNKALELSMFLSIPATIALMIGSIEIVSALFGYGSFDELSVKIQPKHFIFFLLDCLHLR